MAAMLLAPNERLSDDDALLRFTDFVTAQGLELYPAQEEALLELLSNKHAILSTPTGSGKSLVATFLHFLALARGQTSVYTCPIKALVNEKFFALCETFGAERVGMITGDASINADAPIVCCTAEILMNRALHTQGALPDAVIMDEFHYYADRERGVAWQVPLLLLEKTQFLLMSATLGDTSVIEASLTSLTSREVARISSAQRPVPLDFVYAETPLHETIQSLIESDRAPILEGREARAQRLAAGDGRHLRHAVRQRAAKVGVPRNRAAPRRAPAALSIDGRAARAEGSAQGRLRN